MSQPRASEAPRANIEENPHVGKAAGGRKSPMLGLCHSHTTPVVGDKALEWAQGSRQAGVEEEVDAEVEGGCRGGGSGGGRVRCDVGVGVGRGRGGGFDSRDGDVLVITVLAALAVEVIQCVDGAVCGGRCRRGVGGGCGGAVVVRA